MTRYAMCFALSIACAAVCWGEDVAETNTVLKIYPVGNIVSSAAMKSSFSGKMTAQEWATEYPETISALEELQVIVETMCSQSPQAVSIYAPKLSLLVRHTPDGHEEVSQLLKDLEELDDKTIQLNCVFVSMDHLYGNIEDSELGYLKETLIKQRLNSEESRKFKEMISKTPSLKKTITLKPGRRIHWGPAGIPCSAMAQIHQKTGELSVRMDFISDESASDTVPVGSQILTFAEGETALMHHYFDGSSSIWMITASTNNN